MFKDIIYAIIVIVINYSYMIIFSNGSARTIKNFTISVIGWTIIGAIFIFDLMPLNLFVVLTLGCNFFSMFYFTRKSLIAVLFSAFSYAIYHIIWYLSFYKYYELSGLNLPFPFLNIPDVPFTILLLSMITAHIAVASIVYHLMRKYRIYPLIEQYQSSAATVIFYVLFFVVLFVISLLLFSMWQTYHYHYLSLVLLFTYVLLLLFIVLTIFLITKNKINQENVENQILHAIQLEEENYKVQLFRHDYKNILMTFDIFLKNDDIEGLKEYFYKDFQFSTNAILPNDEYVDLRNLHILPLKGLIENKIKLAQENDICVEAEILPKVEEVSMPLIDLIRCLGILFDNALEESLNVMNPKIKLLVKEYNDSLHFSIANRLSEPKKISLEKLTNNGFSTKGKGRGKGLHSLTQLVSSNKGAFFDIYIEEGYIYCELIIKK